MTTPDYDHPEVEEKWCEERRAEVTDYLKREGIKHAHIEEWPSWHIAPYVSIWFIESANQHQGMGWWVICGDLPTDYVSAENLGHPRNVMRSIAKRWLEVSDYMRRGEMHPTVEIGTPESWPELGPLLKSRAKILANWAKDDSVWED